MKLLLIEDDIHLADILCEKLSGQGYLVDVCHNGEDGLYYALNASLGYDAILLDRMLPVVDGLTILKALRAKALQTPVLLLTGLADVDDRVDGLDAGADDYLVKPFEMKELLARVRALVRRPAELKNNQRCTFGDLVLDMQNRELSSGKKTMQLTKKEADLLAVLMLSPGCSLSRDQLLMKVWGTDTEVESGNVDNYISFLRRRLVTVDCKTVIKTVYGAGYQLETEA